MRLFLVSLLLMLPTGCVDDDVDPVAAFETPTGLAVAGTQKDRLFISNSAQDTVQVMNLGEELADIDFVFGPAARVPLRIPAGLGPADLVPSADRRWVVVLNLVSESLRAIDADRLLLARDADGVVVQMPLGSVGVRPSAMVASPEECGPECVGRVYVTLAGAGSIVGVDLMVTGGLLRFELSRVHAVGGEPANLAVRGDGRMLFATDAANPDLIRVDLTTGAYERRDLGSLGGPVAVTTDGSAVIVGRPLERDLVVFRDADGPGLARHDSNPLRAPIPRCTWRCDEDPSVCADAHLADRAVCETDDGLVSSGNDYDAVYLGEVPTHIVALGLGAGMAPLTTACIPLDEDDKLLEGNEVTREFAEFATIANLDGSVYFLGLRDTPDAPLAPQMVSTTYCRSPSVSAWVAGADDEETEVRLDEFLTTCPASPEGRRRFQCIRDRTDTEAGVVISPGNSSRKDWMLSWEASWIDRTSARGLRPGAGVIEAVPVVGTSCATNSDCASPTLCDDGVCAHTVFSDLVEALHAKGIRPCATVSGERCTPNTDPADIVRYGDILEITSTPLGDCPLAACDDADDDELDERAFERRIVAVEPFGDVSRLYLDRPIPPSCFRSGGVLEYRIRVGDQWSGGPTVEGGLERIGPGQRMGPGGDVGRQRREMFGFLDFDVRADLPACERYEADGRVACEDPEVTPDNPTCVPVMDDKLARGDTLVIRVKESTTAFRSGASLNTRREPTGAAGRIPGGMIVSEAGAPEPVVFVSYSGTNGVLGMVPFDVESAFEADRYILLR